MIGAAVRPISGTQRLLGSCARDWAEHTAILGPIPVLSLSQLTGLVSAAGLTGRGGAGFLTARKIAAISAARCRPVVVGNAMEGELLSHKDQMLLERCPHLVLDGLAIVAHACRARRQILAVGERIDATGIRRAAATRPGPTAEVQELVGGFIGGQESAVVNQLNHGPAVPMDPHTPVYHRGVDGRPTLVMNVETLAHLGLLARFGADWFRSQGTAQDPGTFLVTVSGMTRTGVFEVARGTPLRELLTRSGLDLGRLGAVLVGGYHGTWLPAAAANVPLCTEELRTHGASTGAGVIHALGADRCGLQVSARIASYLAEQTAGQCGPCINGMPRMAETLARLATPGADMRLVAEVDRLRGLVIGRGACAHPDGTARFVASAMVVFADHVQAHLKGRCHATTLD